MADFGSDQGSRRVEVMGIWVYGRASRTPDDLREATPSISQRPCATTRSSCPRPGLEKHQPNRPPCQPAHLGEWLQAGGSS